MFDLKFHTSVLDKMPVGTSFKDSGHLITKKDEGWQCEDCYIVTPQDSSSAYLSTPSREIALDKFAGAEIDPDDLDPRLLAFLPAGTKVADSNTEKYEGWYLFKTKSGRWVWAMEIEGAETTANYGMGIEDMSGQDRLRPFRLVSPDTAEAESESEKTPEGKTRFTASEATNFKDCRFRDRDDDVWLFDEETDRWRFILADGSLSSFLQYERLNPSLEPLTLVEGEIEVEPETEPEPDPAEKTEFSASEASEQKDTVFEDDEGDTWFFDFGLQRWRAFGPGWAYAKEELDSLYGPYTKVGPYYEFDRPWTAEEANDFKDKALEDSDGDIWTYDAPSEMWKCRNRGALDRDELDETFQPYRIKKAAQARTAAPGSAIFLGYDEPFQETGGTEEVTFEGSAKEAVELLDRIARSLESIDRKLGDK